MGVDVARDDILADAAFAGDEHLGVAGGRACGQRAHMAHRAARVHELDARNSGFGAAVSHVQGSWGAHDFGSLRAGSLGAKTRVYPTSALRDRTHPKFVIPRRAQQRRYHAARAVGRIR